MADGDGAADGPPECADARIDWAVPPVRAGWAGHVDRLMGPGMSRGERLVELLGGALCCALLAVLAVRTGAYGRWSLLQAAVAAVVALDMVGGVLTLAGNTTKRWYHLRSAGAPRRRRILLSVHLVHLAAVAFLLLPGGAGRNWQWLLVNTALLAAAAVVVESAPLPLVRPVAMACYLVAVLVNLVWFPVPRELLWFTPLFFLKLVVCLLVPEAPLAGTGRREK
ncbi:hypothetical protein CUT44_01675 [Streptomyces carminius]|uniref:Uncharacterized protein n=1 Tax=Streptomyces carminius TaxID=2665496 RepID=A0A2M8MC51_9ACTN|nr:hypothetical protein [Streptomyces carminius]PJE97986.1 hypothetical protein CUT44_09935 [Streptomyces carminius]PJF01812.1 hypothetical protein CUT44_01675 [Streptomyces carminius]